MAANTLKATVARNITTMRTLHHMTQFELGEKINYSDKAVSRWERADAVPDAGVLLQLSELFGVTVDWLLHDHSEEEKPAFLCRHHNRPIVTAITMAGIWTLSLLVFCILYLTGQVVWLLFAYTVPVSLITLLVFNSVWGSRKQRVYIVSGIVWSILAVIYLTALPYNWWILFLLGVPAQLIVFLCFRLQRHCKER